jgi:hypothetical protein
MPARAAVECSSLSTRATRPAPPAASPIARHTTCCIVATCRRVDLSNPRLRKLATALGPAYVRVSGTWANTSYFQDSDAPAQALPPKGFGGVLTRRQWQGAVDFARAVDAKIVTSFATSPGTRDAARVWAPGQARRFLASTESLGGSIAAAEFMNEPTAAEMGDAPKGYDAAAYGRDIAAQSPRPKTQDRKPPTVPARLRPALPSSVG